MEGFYPEHLSLHTPSIQDKPGASSPGRAFIGPGIKRAGGKTGSRMTFQ
jgi:hypothetical protein